MGRIINSFRKSIGTAPEKKQGNQVQLDDFDRDLKWVSDEINRLILSEARLKDHAARVPFYKTMVNGLIETQSELTCVFSQLEANEIMPVLEALDAKKSGINLFKTTDEVTDFVAMLVQKKDELKPLKLVNILADKFPGNYFILKAQFEILKENLIHKAIRAKASAVYNEMDELRGQYHEPDIRYEALALMNKLLLSQPGDGRQTLLDEYQAVAMRCNGCGDPFVKNLGIALIAVSICLSALIFSSLTAPAVGIIVGSIVTYGLFEAVSGLQRGQSKILQNLHDSVNEKPEDQLTVAHALG